MAKMMHLIEAAEIQSRPREYVVNRKSGKVHRALTHYVDVGPEALAFCVYKYGRSSVRLCHTLEGVDWKTMCTTCLADKRATASTSPVS